MSAPRLTDVWADLIAFAGELPLEHQARYGHLARQLADASANAARASEEVLVARMQLLEDSAVRFAGAVLTTRLQVEELVERLAPFAELLCERPAEFTSPPATMTCLDFYPAAPASRCRTCNARAAVRAHADLNRSQEET